MITAIGMHVWLMFAVGLIFFTFTMQNPITHSIYVQYLLIYLAIEKKKQYFVITQVYFQLNSLLKTGKQLQSIDLKQEKDLTTQWFQIRNGTFGNDVNIISQ